jgi:ketosteroid isomerase-like protein
VSQENVEIVRRFFAAVADGDIERAITFFDEDIEWDLSRRQLEPLIFRGHEGFREFVSLQSAVWVDQKFNLTEVLDAGDSAFIRVRFVSTGRGGIEVGATAWFAWTFCHGLVTRATMYQTEADALKAVGLI